MALTRASRTAEPPITAHTLDRAVSRGILTRMQVAELHELAALAPARDPEPAPALTARERAGLGTNDPENLRFIGGFADVFVTIGMVLFLGALGQMTGAFEANASTGPAVVAAASWALAEYFTRRRRMALPSIVLLLVFVGAGFAAVQGTLVRFGIGLTDALSGDATALPLVAAGLSTALLAALHHWRFRVPITVAAGVASLSVGIATAIELFAPGVVARYPTAILAGFGLAIFLLAMRFDLKDPERVTRNTDIAFWLHLLAAPLIVRAVLPAAGGEGFSTDWIFTAPATLSTGTAVLVLALFLVLGLVSVLIDRRALLVAGLSFAGVAYWSVLEAANLAEDNGVVITLFSLGAFILLVSVGWKPMRRLLLTPLPGALTRRLPRVA